MTRIARARVEGEWGASPPVPTLATPSRPRRGKHVPLADVIADIAERVARLSVHRRDPEAFHIQKSDLAHELRAVARRLGGSP